VVIRLVWCPATPLLWTLSLPLRPARARVSVFGGVFDSWSRLNTHLEELTMISTHPGAARPAHTIDVAPGGDVAARRVGMALAFAAGWKAVAWT
jgi:hypothetical protein